MSKLAFNKATRSDLINQLPSQVFDVAIVGGGITGAAIARDCQLRGLKTLLIEKDDFASGTSSRSSKLVHGGVRYLEQFEFGLVFEATRERARLWSLAPQLCHPIPFLFPAYKTSRVRLWKLAAGLWLYDFLSLFKTPTLHKTLFTKRALEAEPKLKSDGLTGAIRYWDGATDDGLLTLVNVIDAYQAGATTLSRCELLECAADQTSEGPTAQSPVQRLSLKDTLSGHSFEARAQAVVCATGPWTDRTLALLGCAPKRPVMAPTRGSHIVVPKTRLPSENAVVIFHPDDGRVLFTIPWGDFTVVGTTDVFDQAAPESVAITQNEIDYLIRAAEHMFPGSKLVNSDVVSVWSGLRPLMAPPDAANASSISREHHIEWVSDSVLMIAGGKLTTHREMAEQCVDALIEKRTDLNDKVKACQTRKRPLPLLAVDAAKTRAQDPIGSSEAAQISLVDVRAMLATQMILSLEDFFVRRTQIFYKEPHHGWLLLPKIKNEFCSALGWSDSDWARECKKYEAYLKHTVLDVLGRTLPVS